MFSDRVSSVRLWLLGALIVFLPLSAWLISVTAQPILGLVRDGLLVIFLLLVLVDYRQWRRPNLGVWLALLFILATALSFFTREDSALQYLRGVRFLIEPLLLFVGISLLPPVGREQTIWKLVGVSFGVVIVGAVVEWLYPNLLRLSLNESARGYLGQIHLAGELRRLQSTLAGPNALGLFAMTALLLTPIWFSLLRRPLAILTVGFGLVVLLLTFSRSSYFGFIVGLAAMLIASRSLLTINRRWLWGLLGTFLAVVIGLLVWSPEALTRINSNTVRFEQYQRVWDERDEIGIFGRGAGAAGLSSVDRIDGGPNYFTENTYLDAYEATGLLGLISYVGLWLYLGWFLLRRQNLVSVTAGAAALGLFAAGFFINHYTGQAALWLTILVAAMALVPQEQTS